MFYDILAVIVFSIPILAVGVHVWSMGEDEFFLDMQWVYDEDTEDDFEIPLEKKLHPKNNTKVKLASIKSNGHSQPTEHLTKKVLDRSAKDLDAVYMASKMYRENMKKPSVVKKPNSKAQTIKSKNVVSLHQERPLQNVPNSKNTSTKFKKPPLNKVNARLQLTEISVPNDDGYGNVPYFNKQFRANTNPPALKTTKLQQKQKQSV